MPLLSFGKKSVASLRNQFVSILKEMESKDPEIEGSVLLRSDGLILAAALPEVIDRDLVAAMSASVLNVSSRVLEELHRGKVENVIVKGSEGIVVVISVAPEIDLAAIARKDANLGLMLVEMKRAAEKIREILESM